MPMEIWRDIADPGDMPRLMSGISQPSGNWIAISATIAQ
jgi:hypothetical protein